MLLNKINILHFLNPLDWIIFSFSIFVTFISIYIGNKLKRKNFSKFNISIDCRDLQPPNDRLASSNAPFKMETPLGESNSENKKTKIIDHLLMGRQLTLPLFIATLCSSWYGGIFGVTQIAFENGIFNFITQGLFWYFAYFSFAFCLAKKIRKTNSITMPDLINNLYGKKSATFSAILILVNVLPISYAISIGLFLQLLFPLSLPIAISLGVALVACYSYFGGFRAVVFSDTIQFIIMCVGVFLVLCFSYFKFGGLSYLKTNLPTTHFQLNGNYSFAYTISWLFIAFTATFVNPTFYQRCFAAKTPQTAQRGILISIFIWFLFDICTTFGAMYAKAAIPNAESLNAYLTYAIQILPSGIRGLLVESILATILSTLDTQLFLASNALFYDLNWLKKFKNLNFEYLFAILIVAIITITIAIFFEGRIEDSWRIFRSYFSACFLVPFICGYVYKAFRKDNYFITTSIITIIVISSWDIFNIEKTIGINSFYIGNISALLTLVIMHLISKLMMNDTKLKKDQNIYTQYTSKCESAFLKNISEA